MFLVADCVYIERKYTLGDKQAEYAKSREVRLRQLEFPFLIRWTSKNLAALPKKTNDGPQKKKTKQEIIYANNILY